MNSSCTARAVVSWSDTVHGYFPSARPAELSVYKIRLRLFTDFVDCCTACPVNTVFSSVYNCLRDASASLTACPSNSLPRSGLLFHHHSGCMCHRVLMRAGTYAGGPRPRPGLKNRIDCPYSFGYACFYYPHRIIYRPFANPLQSLTPVANKSRIVARCPLQATFYRGLKCNTSLILRVEV